MRTTGRCSRRSASWTTTAMSWRQAGPHAGRGARRRSGAGHRRLLSARTRKSSKGRVLVPEGNEVHRWAERHTAAFAGRKLRVAPGPNLRFTDADKVDGKILKQVLAVGKH